MKIYDLASSSYSRSNRPGHLGKFWFSRSQILALDNSQPPPGSRRQCWLTTFKFIFEQDQIWSMEVEEARHFQGILLPQDSHNGGKNALDKLWSLASSLFFAGSLGERCAADFDSVGDRSTSFNFWQTQRCANPCD